MKFFIILLISFSSFLFGSDFDEMYKEGETLYKKTCSSCHGENGWYKEMKFLVDPRELRKSILTEEQMFKVIRDGAQAWGAKSDIMPSFKTVFSDEKIKSIAYFVSKKINSDIDKKLNDLYSKSEKVAENKKAKMLKRGKKIYNRNCSWCHGKTGAGDGLATTSPVDSIFPYDLTKTPLDSKQLFLYTKFGGKYWGANKDDMPGWEKKYNDYTLKSVAKYIDEVLKVKKN